MTDPAQSAHAPAEHPNQFALMGQRRFAPFFWTQFCGAGNDNLFKFAFTVLVTYQLQVTWLPPQMAGLVIGALFILPYVLFSATSGQLADRWDKARLMRMVKNLEIAIMLLAAYGFIAADVAVLLLDARTGVVPADAALGVRVDTEEAARSAAVVALQAADVALGVRVDSEAASRASAVSALQAADAVHTAAISAEAAARTAADSTLTSNLNTEVARAVAAENVLGTRITQEHDARVNIENRWGFAINTLYYKVDTEIAARLSADYSDLLNRIDMLFLYFFHHSSNGATIDADHQIQWLYGNP
jgi:hypothetical protein